MMDGSGWDAAQTVRNGSGRFAPGISGNPAGKRKGTRNRATVLAEALAADESGGIARVVIDKALSGDGVAARFCLGLLVPKLRSRPIELDLPECNSAYDVVTAFDVTLAAMATGEITPDEALTVSRVLDLQRRAIESRARQQERAQKRGRDAALVPLDAAASASHAEPAESSGVADTPPVAPNLAQTGADLHSACKPGAGEKPAAMPAEPPAEPGASVEAKVAPARRPLPGFGSACIPPAISRRAARSHGGPAPAAAVLCSTGGRVL
jgi:hypothetical protein